jgi:4-amino-4-deoxy-L-arabinose transferase-like glycosyltransferase
VTDVVQPAAAAPALPSAGGTEGTRALSQRVPGRACWPADLLLLLAVSGWLTVVGLWRIPLLDPDEPRSALVARIMVDRGDWLVPHLPQAYQHQYPGYPVEGDLIVYLNKPPLFFWLEAVAITLFGPTDLAVRLPSVAAQVLTVLLVYLIGRARPQAGTRSGRRAGLLGGLVMATALLAVILGRVARMDMVLVCLMTAMLLATIRLICDGPAECAQKTKMENGERRLQEPKAPLLSPLSSLLLWQPRAAWLALLYVSAGLGLLTKGPVALVIPAAVLLATIAVTGRWGDLRRLHPVVGTVVALLISAPWFLYMNYRFPPTETGAHGFLYEFFVRQNIERATVENFGAAQPPGFLLAILAGGFVPWTLFLPGACAGLLRSDWSDRKNRPVGILLLLWSAGVLLLFSLSKTQFRHYVLPAFPPLAVLAGGYLDDRLRCATAGLAGRATRFFRVTLALTLALTLAMCLVVTTRVTLASTPASRAPASGWRAPGGPGWPLRISVMVVTTAGLLAALVFLLRRRPAVAVGLLVAGTCVILTFGLAADPFSVYMAHSTKGEARAIRELFRPGDQIVALQSPYSLRWYLWPEPVLDPTTGLEPGGAARWEALTAALNSPRRSFCLLGRGKSAGASPVVDRLRQAVRWPLRVIMETPRHILLFIEPEAGGVGPEHPVSLVPEEPPGSPNAGLPGQGVSSRSHTKNPCSPACSNAEAPSRRGSEEYVLCVSASLR